MRFYPLQILLLLLGAAAAAHGDTGLTALGALKLLPKEAPSKVALIQAFEGKPNPERWHILIHDAKEESGVHEYVVAGGEVVASRAISQFADELKAEDVIGAEMVKFDTDKAVKLAQGYARANQLTIASFNYVLKKDGNDAVPLWHVNCLDAKGESIGKLVVTATKGVVVSHDGFAADPNAAADKPAEKPLDKLSEKPKLDRREVRRAEAVRRPQYSEDENRPSFFKRLFGGGGGESNPREIQPRPR